VYSNSVERSIRKLAPARCTQHTAATARTFRAYYTRGSTHTGLPTDMIDEEHIEAMNDHGMIVVKVPKLEKHKGTAPRLIPIKPVEAKLEDKASKLLKDKAAQKTEV